MFRKFVGDKMSIEATSRDGRLWDVHFYDRGHLAKHPGTSEADLERMAAQKGMKLAPGRS